MKLTFSPSKSHDLRRKFSWEVNLPLRNILPRNTNARSELLGFEH